VAIAVTEVIAAAIAATKASAVENAGRRHKQLRSKRRHKLRLHKILAY